MARRIRRGSPSQSKSKSKEKWAQVLGVWKRSGLGGAAFCRKNRLNPPSFYAWKRRLSLVKGAGGHDRPSFLPVTVIPSAVENHPVLELALKNGQVLRLYREVPASVLAQMAQALEAEGC